MPDNATEQTGNYQPPVAAAAGDDGYVVPGSEHTAEVITKDSNALPILRMNAVDIRRDIAKNLDMVAGWTDYNRERFTQQAVSHCKQMWGEFNWIMCHPAHSYVWSGARGVDWEHWHYELDVYGAGTIGYEVYWARAGVFSLNGDGGFINWAYIGNVEKLDGGKVLYFSPP